MISWAQIGYGAALSAVVAAVALALAARGQRVLVATGGAVATAAGALAWNAILRAAHGDQFFTDAPIGILPASWQDTGSAVFALAAATLILGMLAVPTIAARRLAAYAILCGLAAFLVDVYLY
jgi:hypothetical protein